MSPSATPAPGAQIQGGIPTIQATVTSFSDDDTVHVKLNGRDERVRMIGVNCPELSHHDLGIKEEPYGREAKVYTEKQLSGKKVWLEFDVQERDNYGRMLAYVWLEPPFSAFKEAVRAKVFNARLLLALEKRWAIQKVFAPHGDPATYCRQFFEIDYQVSESKITVKDAWGWHQVVP